MHNEKELRHLGLVFIARPHSVQRTILIRQLCPSFRPVTPPVKRRILSPSASLPDHFIFLKTNRCYKVQTPPHDCRRGKHSAIFG